MEAALRAFILDQNARYFGNAKKAEEEVGVGEVKALYKPPPESHKGENGILLIVGGGEKYHGAPLLAAKIASKIVDLVYFSSTPENNRLLKKMKSELCEFIAVPPGELEEAAGKADAVLVGPGMGISIETEAVVLGLLKEHPGKKFVLDADALKVLDPGELGSNCLVTPHQGEFKALFGLHPTGAGNSHPSGEDRRVTTVLRVAKKYGCVILLKGVVDVISDGETVKLNRTGNQGMTKGGTGDVLAGLCAALACKNDLFLSAGAGAFLNGLAGDRLLKKVSYYFSASDLVEEIPRALKWCEEF